MVKNSKTVRKTIPKLTDDVVSEYREWYNKCLLGLKGKRNVLDIGKSLFWDYSVLFDKYTSIDNSRDAGADIVEDIFNNSIKSESFDTVLCNGMMESSNGQMQRMVDEVYRILESGGTAIFGMSGENYPHDVIKYDGTDYFTKFKVIKEENIRGEYYFKVCKK